MAYTPFDLPYSSDALAPRISAETFEYHYGKHYKTYVDKYNGLVAGQAEESKDLVDVIRSSSGGLFNNAAQIWNHEFYFKGLAPDGGGPANGALGDAITAQWGSFDEFKSEFTTKAVTLFGSGWAWLVKNADGKLEITGTANAETPLTQSGVTPILTCDVWEHAYYVDYRNARPKYLENWWELVNWKFANDNFAG